MSEGSVVLILSRVNTSSTTPSSTRRLTCTWVGDSDTGVVPSMTTTEEMDKVLSGKKLVMGITVPDNNTAPSDLYRVSLVDENGLDVLGGYFDGLSSTESEQLEPSIKNRIIDGPLTLSISDNSVGGGGGVVKFYFTS